MLLKLLSKALTGLWTTDLASNNQIDNTLLQITLLRATLFVPCTAPIGSGAPAILANFCSRLTDTCGLTFRRELVKGEIPNGREKKIACAKKSRYVVVGLIRANLGQKFAYFNMLRYKKTN